MSAASQQVLREQKGGEMFSLQAAETDPTAQGKWCSSGIPTAAKHKLHCGILNINPCFLKSSTAETE